MAPQVLTTNFHWLLDILINVPLWVLPSGLPSYGLSIVGVGVPNTPQFPRKCCPGCLKYVSIWQHNQGHGTMPSGRSNLKRCHGAQRCLWNLPQAGGPTDGRAAQPSSKPRTSTLRCLGLHLWTQSKLLASHLHPTHLSYLLGVGKHCASQLHTAKCACARLRRVTPALRSCALLSKSL